MDDFKTALTRLLNAHCIDSRTAIPDFILANMLDEVIGAIIQQERATFAARQSHRCAVCESSMDPAIERFIAEYRKARDESEQHGRVTPN